MYQRLVLAGRHPDHDDLFSLKSPQCQGRSSSTGTMRKCSTRYGITSTRPILFAAVGEPLAIVRHDSPTCRSVQRACGIIPTR